MTITRQLSLAAGEISPALYGRVDIVKYQTGLRTCRNCFILKHGGAANRPGSQFIGEVKDSSKAVRLIPFIFNSSQTYILEFGENYIRVIKDGAQITETAQNITAITKADPAVITIAGHGYSNGDEVVLADIGGMIELNGRNALVANKATNTFEITDLAGNNIDSSGYTTYTSGGTAAKIYEVTTTYAEADLSSIDYAQSADVITLVHPTYAPATLSRSADNNWTLATITFAPTIGTPQNLVDDSASAGVAWKVTAIADETFEESLASSSTIGTDGTPSLATNLDWDAVSGAAEYNIYKTLDIPGGVFGFAGISINNDFTDTGQVPDYTDTPPTARNPFNAADDYPSAVNYIQQRIWYANTNNNTETIWGSRIGLYDNFTISRPLQDDDAVTFTLVSSQVSSVRWILDLGRMIALTDSGEWSIDGNSAGIVTPFEINARQNAYNGAVADLKPLIINNTAVFVQARGSIVRDISYSFDQDVFKGNDLTIFSTHLVEDFTLSDWAYQKTPNSIVWSVRSDGSLLALTYVREHSLFGWSRHDFQGETVENTAVVPEGNEDFLYIVVQRTINSNSVRYIEKLSSRLVDDIIDNRFMDSHLTYDGRNTDTTHTMTLSGGTNWDEEEQLTCTSSAVYFASVDVGKAIFFNGTDANGDTVQIRCEIEAFTSTTIVTVRPNKTVPAASPDFRDAAISDWDLAVDTVTGLWHLEGEDVSVFGDRFVVASPNNNSMDTVTVSDGSISLDDHYSVIHVGLPYYSDIETLNIDTENGEPLLDKYKNISNVHFQVEETRGLWVGSQPPSNDTNDPKEGLYEMKIRETEGYDSAVDLATGIVDVNIESHWNSNGRIFLRQIDPVPMTILSIAPAGMIPFRR